MIRQAQMRHMEIKSMLNYGLRRSAGVTGKRSMYMTVR